MLERTEIASIILLKSGVVTVMNSSGQHSSLKCSLEACSEKRTTTKLDKRRGAYLV